MCNSAGWDYIFNAMSIIELEQSYALTLLGLELWGTFIAGLKLEIMGDKVPPLKLIFLL